MFWNHKFEETILAKGKTMTMNTRASHLNNNIMLVGASGRGKSRNFIKPNIMQMNSNYVVSDPKGEIVRELGTMLKENGYTIKVLNLVDLLHSDTYNPFHYVRNEMDIYKMINYLLLNLNPNFGQCNDPFWDRSSQALLAAVCFYLYYECEEEDRNFTNVMKLLRCLEVREDQEDFESTLDIMFKELQATNPEHIAVKQYAIFKSAAGKTAKSIQISTEVYLQWFNLVEYENLTSSDSMDLEKLSFEKTALFVIVSDTDKSQNWLAGVFYSQLFDRLCGMHNAYHIRFFLDDFVCTAKIPDFDYKMAMIRSRNLSCVIAIQDEAQLEKEYGKAAQGIITNCDSYVFLGASNIDICNVVARRLGDKHISGTNIRRMKYEECVVICGNQGAIHKKYDIKKHPRYAKMAENESSDRFYDLTKWHIIPPKSEVRGREVESKESPAVVAPILRAQNRKTKRFAERLAVRSHLKEMKGLRTNLFDSREEEFLHSIITRIDNLNICVHQHLRDLFSSEDTALSKKLSMMHCDFLIRDPDMKALFGIEIDGSQHIMDVRQQDNDRLKDELFETHQIPLLRFPAAYVRNNPSDVLHTILKIASQTSGSEYSLAGEIPPYHTFRDLTPVEDILSALDKLPELTDFINKLDNGT